MFPQGREYVAFTQWVSKGLDWFAHLFHKCTLTPKSFTKLQAEYGIAPSHFLAYLSSGCWKSWGGEPRFFMERSFLDSLANSRHFSISAVYCHLQTLYWKPLSASNVPRWNDDFPAWDVTDKLIEGYNRIRTLMRIKLCWETQFKLLHRAYVPLFIDNSKGKGQQSTCPKWWLPRPSLEHCLWFSPQVKVLWEKIQTYLKEV